MMEFTGELKDKLSKCQNAQEAKDKLKDAGIILSDDELDSVAGGIVQAKTPDLKHGVISM